MCVAERFPHISGLDLADPHFIGENLDVNIGSDHYWEVVTGNVMRGVCEPTAIETKFGWVLSGPVHDIRLLQILFPHMYCDWMHPPIQLNLRQT